MWTTAYLFGQDSDKIHSLVQEIQDKGFDLTIEDDVYTFLGVEVKFDSTAGPNWID
jgi:hypothetical protein